MRKYGRRSSKRNIDADAVYDSNAEADSAFHTRKRQKVAVEMVQPLGGSTPVSSSKARTNPSSLNVMMNTVVTKGDALCLQATVDEETKSLDPLKGGLRHVVSPHLSSAPYPTGPTTPPDLASTSSTTRKPDSDLESYASPSTRPQPPPIVHAASVDELDSRTSTPRKRAKNLSQLFDISPSPGSLAKNDGVVRRMLTRSRTESSIGSESASDSLSSSTASLVRLECTSQRANPARPLTPTPSVKESLVEASPSSPTPTRQPLVAPHARTYGGKSRSFLMTLPISQLSDGSNLNDMQKDAEEEFEVRESYTDLRARWGVDNSEDDPRMPSPTNSSPGKRKAQKTTIPYFPAPLPNGMMNDLKSITELRSKGESRRFLDEVGYLFEGLDPNGGIGLRRASALEIVTKLCDSEFARKAKAADFLGRSWIVLREAGAGSGDKILDVILVFFAALVARDSKSFTELALKTDLVDTLFCMLRSASLEKDWLGSLFAGVNDLELKKLGIVNNTEKALLVGLCNTISIKSGVFSEPVALSVQLLASQALVRLSPTLIHPQYLSALRCSLKRELSLIPPRVTAYMAGLSLFPLLSPSSQADRPSFEHLENCLRLLDSFLSGQWTGQDLRFLDQLEADWEWLVDGLIALCIAANVAIKDEHGHKRKTAYNCFEITFHVLISLTHENQRWCQTIIHHDSALPLIMRTMGQYQDRRSVTNNISEDEHTIQAEDDRDAQSLDRVCLALGLLTNLIQLNEEAKDLSQEIRINPTCPARRICLRGCRCMHRIGGLEFLALIYGATVGNVIDPGAEFLRGHLAVLFGLLMQRSDRNQDALLEVLPGESDYIKLNSLANQAREFVTFYAELTTQLVNATKLGESQGHNPDASKMSLRADNSIGRIIRDGRGEDVAREVVSFLEQLRDRPLDP